FKKLGQQNPYTPTYYLLTAKYLLASGKIRDFESNIELAVSSSLMINKTSVSKHGKLLADIGELYILNGSYRVAREYLDQAKKILDKADLPRWNLLYAEALTGQGYYNEALSILYDQGKYFSGRAMKQES